MNSFLESKINPPKDWVKFEDMVADLYTRMWDEKSFTKIGRSGQKQFGIDILNQDTSKLGGYYGIQCKNKKILESELSKIVEEAENFKPELSKLIITTTIVKDQKLSQRVLEISKKRVAMKKFSVEIVFWDDIKLKLADYPSLIGKYYPEYRIDKKFNSFQKEIKTIKETTKKIKEQMMKVSIPTIDSNLWKNDTHPDFQKGKFFRYPYPAWIDYDEGYAVERPEEIEKIESMMDMNKVVLVEGAPASGKSVLLKHIGYKKKNEGWETYVIELKGTSSDRFNRYMDELKFLPEQSLVIVDDAHLQRTDLETFIDCFKKQTCAEARMLIGSRVQQKGDYSYNWSDLLPNVEIEAEDASYRIICTVLAKIHSINEKGITKLYEEGIFDEFQDDLWCLAYALETYSHKEKGINRHKILDKIHFMLATLETQDKRKIDMETILPVLACFYRFEIAVDRHFFDEQMGIMPVSRQTIEDLKSIRVIQENNGLLSLFHSSIAKLYFEMFDQHRTYGRKIKQDYDNFNLDIFRVYLDFNPRNFLDVFSKLGFSGEKSENAKKLFLTLGQEDNFLTMLKTNLEIEQNLEYLKNLLMVPSLWGMAEHALGDQSPTLKEEIENNLKPIIVKFSNIVSYQYLLRDFYKNIIDKLNVQILSKMMQQDKLANISQFLSLLSFVDKEKSLTLLHQLMPQLKSIILNEKNPRNITRLFSTIQIIEPSLVSDLLNEIYIGIILKKLDKELDIRSIEQALFQLTFIDLKTAIALYNEMDFEKIVEKIENEQEIKKIRMFFNKVHYLNPEKTDNIFKRLGAEHLATKMNNEIDNRQVILCFNCLDKKNKVFAKKTFSLLTNEKKALIQRMFSELKNEYKS